MCSISENVERVEESTTMNEKIEERESLASATQRESMTSSSRRHSSGRRHRRGGSLRSSAQKMDASLRRSGNVVGGTVGAVAAGTGKIVTDAAVASRDVVVSTGKLGLDAVKGTGMIVIGTGKVAGGAVVGASKVATGAVIGTGKAAGDAVVVSGRVASDVVVSTGKLGLEVAKGTGKLGMVAVKGTGHIGLEVVKGTGHIGMEVVKGTGHLGMEVVKGGKDVAVGTGRMVVEGSRAAGDMVVGGVVQTGSLGLKATKVAGKAVVDTGHLAGDVMVSTVKGTGKVAGDLVVGTGHLATDAVVSTGKLGLAAGKVAGKAVVGTGQLLRSGTDELVKGISKITHKVGSGVAGGQSEKPYKGPGSVLDLEEFDQFLSQVLCIEVEGDETLDQLDQALNLPLEQYQAILQKIEVGLQSILSFHHQISDILKCEIHAYLGLVYLEQRNHSAAVDTLTKALWYQSRNPEDKLGVALANHRLGIAYGRKRNYQQALALIESSIEVYEAEGVSSEIYVAAKFDRHEFLEQEQLALLVRKRPQSIRRTVSESVGDMAISRRSIARSQSIRSSTKKLQRCRSELHKRPSGGLSALQKMEGSLRRASSQRLDGSSQRIGRSQRIGMRTDESQRSTSQRISRRQRIGMNPDGSQRSTRGRIMRSLTPSMEGSLRSHCNRVKESNLWSPQGPSRRSAVPPSFKQLTPATA